MELTIAMALGTAVVAGVLILAQAVSASARLQENLGAIQEHARFAMASLGAEITQAGYHPRLWEGVEPEPFSGSADDISQHGDRLAVNRWTDRNCHENPNPEQDAAGNPAFFLRTSVFEIREDGQLSLSCSYGPDRTRLVRQVNRLGLIEHVHSLQALYAVDTNADGNADRWLAYGRWQENARVLAVRVGLLLISPGIFGDAGSKEVLSLGGATLDTPDDRLYRLIETTWALMGRVQS
jgi:hypothetical protein